LAFPEKDVETQPAGQKKERHGVGRAADKKKETNAGQRKITESREKGLSPRDARLIQIEGKGSKKRHNCRPDQKKGGQRVNQKAQRASYLMK